MIVLLTHTFEINVPVNNAKEEIRNINRLNLTIPTRNSLLNQREMTLLTLFYAHTFLTRIDSSCVYDI